MNPQKVIREQVVRLTDLPNIGQAGAIDLQILGIDEPQQLIGLCPYALYERLCRQTQSRHDPCVLDVFISITRFMNGEPPQPWWYYTAERKKHIADDKECLHEANSL